MTQFLLIAIVVMIFVVIFQIAKASEYVSVLKGEEKARKQTNKINAFMLISFLIVGLIGVWWCNDLFFGRTLFPQGAASEMGQKIDLMLYITIGVTGVVFVITQILLFWFAFKYQEKDDRKAYYFPHNTKLELLWTTVPAIFLTVLVVFGLKYWFKITSDAPKDAVVVEVTGHQFGWEFRYPGADGILGKKDYKLTKGANGLGVNFDDEASHDDIHVSTTMHIPVNRPVKFVINAQDVIHDVGLTAFRIKMDAVPGIPTTLWFTPLYTTEEMKVRTGNPNYVYEISCDQMCGKGHFSMRGVIIVESEADYKKWLATQEPEYFTIFPDKKPKTDTPAVADSSAKPAPLAAMVDKK
ncbi:MAG: cytochrome c oxidase subunit [Ferruginibacter sp.]|jgi:cytochrome c oxidase subunit 2|uniref:cytochrome c oxidase subunit II n=1 Tax=Ferruginibacter sp. TaxID=1940288 RepID=UPI0026598350|nr:cytochrome c oxidase subunit II [Ferruginibacter sp.]MDB5276863.1 cytochrome c oxidase subunit [Ferruginibacter sp.]